MARDALLYHFALPGVWQPGCEYAPESLAVEGFIHLSTREQLEGTMERFFARAGQLVLLEIKAASLEAEVRYEAVHGSEFPHLYGTLPASAVVRSFELYRDEAGVLALPEALEEPAS